MHGPQAGCASSVLTCHAPPVRLLACWTSNCTAAISALSASAGAITVAYERSRFLASAAHKDAKQTSPNGIAERQNALEIFRDFINSRLVRASVSLPDQIKKKSESGR
jgi:hypothetical protein